MIMISFSFKGKKISDEPSRRVSQKAQAAKRKTQSKTEEAGESLQHSSETENRRKRAKSDLVKKNNLSEISEHSEAECTRETHQNMQEHRKQQKHKQQQHEFDPEKTERTVFVKNLDFQVLIILKVLFFVYFMWGSNKRLVTFLLDHFKIYT